METAAGLITTLNYPLLGSLKDSPLIEIYMADLDRPYREISARNGIKKIGIAYAYSQTFN